MVVTDKTYSQDDLKIFENPWNPQHDLLWKCYRQSEWESCLNAFLGSSGVEMVDEIFHVSNILGDTRGLSDLCGVMETSLIPSAYSRYVLSDTPKTVLESFHSDMKYSGHVPESIRNGVEKLSLIFKNKVTDIGHLVDIFYETVYPEEWRERGFLDALHGVRKWDWNPFLLSCLTPAQTTHGKTAPHHSPITFSSITLATNTFQLSVVVSLIKLVVYTLIEDDTSSQTSAWFDQTKKYWIVYRQWLESFYDELSLWQQEYDKKGLWNTPQGKLCRVLRPCSTYFPCLSFLLTPKTPDKCVFLRVILYHTFVYTEYLVQWSRYLYREKIHTLANQVSSCSQELEQHTNDFISGLSSCGITQMGYKESLIWHDKHIGRKPIPPCLHLWLRLTPKRFQMLKNFFSLVGFQRQMILDIIQQSFTLNTVFESVFHRFVSVNLSVYQKLQELDLLDTTLSREVQDTDDSELNTHTHDTEHLSIINTQHEKQHPPEKKHSPQTIPPPRHEPQHDKDQTPDTIIGHEDIRVSIPEKQETGHTQPPPPVRSIPSHLPQKQETHEPPQQSDMTSPDTMKQQNRLRFLQQYVHTLSFQQQQIPRTPVSPIQNPIQTSSSMIPTPLFGFRGASRPQSSVLNQLGI